ncbi:DUF2931 family protein [Marinobacter profundi]|uniref:DUF2931 domain-containing protein n=1 Tax=Marinobacter profundi TaxID=2666256 RepID=A0A2G1UPV4_9GAMM|nr:DUF2931 family protein [Marinobacter profundi]PHQ16508.1 hypothetical protein CLH61_05440 [Marinobacter profundi]
MREFHGLIMAITLVLSGCSVFSDAKEETTWYFQLATPRHYDVWVEHLEFELSGVRHWFHPAGSMSCCWKGPYGPGGISGRMEPFPNFIAIQWFSFAEQKFYQRLIEIPREWQDLMKVPAPRNTQLYGVVYRPRNFLTFGLAPGGEIVVWIMNQVGNEIELARLRANEMERDPNIYRANTQEYWEENGDYLKKHGVQLSGW